MASGDKDDKVFPKKKFTRGAFASEAKEASLTYKNLKEHVLLLLKGVDLMVVLLVLGIMTGIRCEGRRNFGDQRMDVHKELCTLPTLMTRTPESKGGCRVDPGQVRLGVDSVPVNLRHKGRERSISALLK